MGAAERERLLAAKNNMASVGWGKGDESLQAQEAVLVAERELAAAEGESFAEVIDLGVRWDGGAPMPQVISDGSTTVLLCYASEPAANAQGDRAPTSVAAKERSNLIRFTFSLCSSIRFGAPNDEVLHGHPLYGRGLQFYQAHIVRNSTWLAELNAINSAHSQYRGPSERTHFLFAFHDDTFEAIADEVRTEEFEGSMRSALAAEAVRQTSWDPVKAEDLSRAVSHALRHEPFRYGLELDSQGWVEISDLLVGLRAQGAEWNSLDKDELNSMISAAVKQRFEIAGSRIRAFYGHSVDGHIDRPLVDPPAVLFHGTSPEAWRSIQEVGLLPMGRQSVHLSIDETTAAKVGGRKSSTPVILRVDARAAHASGVTFSLGNENVWVATAIPPDFITLPG